jgi:peptide/nickel transport system permease protein
MSTQATTSAMTERPKAEFAEPAQPYWKLVLRRFMKHRMAVAGAITLILLILMSFVGPLLSPYTFDGIDLPNSNQQWPSTAHWLGTDELGRDIFTRLMHAGRISLSVGLSVAFLGVLIGTVVGGLAGYFGKWVDMAGMRVTDVFLSIPILMLLMVMMKFLGKDLAVIVLILGATSWMGVARLVRGEFLSLRNQEFIEASHAQGASSVWIMIRHMLPNALAPIFVAATLGVADAIMLESALSFLGFGIQPPTPSWGNMLTDAQQYMISTPWLAFYPGLLIFLTVASINFVGDGLRDALDPKLKR